MFHLIDRRWTNLNPILLILTTETRLYNSFPFSIDIPEWGCTRCTAPEGSSPAETALVEGDSWTWQAEEEGKATRCCTAEEAWRSTV